MKSGALTSSAPLRGLISRNLVIVLAVITIAVAGLAYEWCHAQTVKSHHAWSPPHRSSPTNLVKTSTH